MAKFWFADSAPIPSFFATFALATASVSTSQGAVFFDDFLGASIDNTIWDTPPNSGLDGGSFVQNAGHLGFDSGGDVNGRDVGVQMLVSTGINPVITPTTTVGDWGMAITDEFEFGLDAGTFNFSGSDPAGNFSVDGSKAHFGSAELTLIPETDVIFLILLGIAIPLIRHRRWTF